MEAKPMFCITCQELHQHSIPLDKGDCMCTYLKHEVREATETDIEILQGKPTREQRLAANILSLLGKNKSDG